MSATKFDGPSHKLFEPTVHHSRQPFIVGVDERLGSPDTATLRYEEAVARGSGGDVRDSSPTDIIPMATFGKAPPSQLPGKSRKQGGGRDVRFQERR